MHLPRHPRGGVDWKTLGEYLRARFSNRSNSPAIRKMRAESDEWRERWKAAGCPPVGHPDCPPTPQELRNRD